MEWNHCSVTLDIDWAPDFVIDEVAGRLIRHGVPATWFVTHSSPAIDRLRRHPDLFELGIHPNFLPGSTQGDCPEEVLDYCLKIVPDAVSSRSHALVQSTPLISTLMERTRVDADVSLFLPRAGALRPVEHWADAGCLVRIPYFWEDDVETFHPSPEWAPNAMLETGPGLKIFDFHPIHVVLNTESFSRYDRLKRSVSNLRELTSDEVAPFINAGAGTGTMFDSLLRRLAAGTGRVCRIRDILRDWQECSRSSARSRAA